LSRASFKPVMSTKRLAGGGGLDATSLAVSVLRLPLSARLSCRRRRTRAVSGEKPRSRRLDPVPNTHEWP
jgi:hypothetical protein